MDPTSNIITVDDLTGNPMHLHWMSGDEMLGGTMSGMFEYRMELASSSDNIKAKDVLGERLTINVPLADDSGVRYFNGHVTAWSYRGRRDVRAIYHATVHPWLWFLNFTTDCRIFNKKSAIDVVKAIFDKYPNAYSEEAIGGEYPSYEYVVQYRETDFNLVCRLLQQEGVYFYFRHEKKRHVLVLADRSDSHKTSPGHEEIPYLPPSSSAKDVRPHFYRWKVSEEIHLGSYSLHDYDYEKARTDLLAVRNADPQQQHVCVGEFFDYPGRYLSQTPGEAIAGVRLEEHHEDGQSIEVEGDTAGLGAGHRVTLMNPPWSDHGIEFLVTSAH
jgi:type VI secretion system secreted protein VgrG